MIRRLYLEAAIDYYDPCHFFTRRGAKERSNARVLRQTIEEVRPELLVVWGMWNLSFNLPAAAERLLPGRVVYYVASYWPLDNDAHRIYWQLPGNSRLGEIVKRPVRAVAMRRLERECYPPDLQYEYVQCISRYVRDTLAEEQEAFQGAGVIVCGIDPKPFGSRVDSNSDSCTGPIRLVYFGSLLPSKGVHTAIEALEKASETTGAMLELTIIGDGHPDYVRQLISQAKELGVANRVNFVGRVPRADIPRILARHDVFLFTSVWHEPLGRTILEAMAAGLVVIGSNVGGSREILDLYSQRLRFEPEDSDELARKIAMVATDETYRLAMAEKGRKLVEERFTLARTIDRLESWFLSIV